MKQLVLGLLIGILFLTACGGTSPTAQLTPNSAVVQTTSTPSPLPTATRTLVPSVTPTASVTPLPTIPTFTPTFDVSTIVTVTPASKAECPVQSDKIIDFIPFDEQKISNVLEALNHGVPLINVLRAIEKGVTLYYSEHGLKVLPDVYVPPMEKDLTNDGNSEIIISNGEGANLVYYVLGCNHQKYDVLFAINNEGIYNMNFQIIKDANKNGLPEILFSEGRCDLGGCGGKIKVIEWDGMGWR